MTEKSSAAIIFIKEPLKFLLLKYTAGHWDLVKGTKERGESDKETLFREAQEETGITDLKIINGFKEKYSYAYTREGKIIEEETTVYLAETKTEKIKLSEEHTDYSWLKYEEAIKKITYEEPKEIIKKANEKIESNY